MYVKSVFDERWKYIKENVVTGVVWVGVGAGVILVAAPSVAGITK